MPVSVRLDARTEGLLNRLAKKSGRTKSQVIREALTALARSEGASAKPAVPYEAIADLIGCAEGGPPDLSERSGEKVRKLLSERPRA
jgi:hypothetical protein